MTNEMNDHKAIKSIAASELLYLKKLFFLQALSEDAVILDHLPYTPQIKMMVAKMIRKFPKSRWTEKLVYRTLVRLRRTESDSTENGQPLLC